MSRESGLTSLGAESVGFDYMSLAKGAAGMLQGAGGMMSGQGGGQQQMTPQQQAEYQRQEAARLQAERSSARLKWGLAAGALAVLAFLIVLVARR